MSDVIEWGTIKAECDGYRAGFVTVFRKYEGQPTDRKDPQGRVLKVSRATFAEIAIGVSGATFGRWIKNAEEGLPLSGRNASVTTGPARTGQVGRQIAKSPAVSVDDKVGMLKDLMSDKKVLKAFREQEAPDVSESDAKAAEAWAKAIVAPVMQSATGLQVPMWVDQLKDIAKELAEWELDEDAISQLRKAHTKLGNEIEVQEFRLGLIEADV